MRFFAAFIVIVIVAFVVFIMWATTPFGSPRNGLETIGTPPTAPEADKVTVLTYNVHFGFGPDEAPKTREDVEATLATIAATITESGADIVCLQEVDFASGRTHDIDMVATLAEKTGLRYVATATMWNLTFLPFPYWPPSGWWGHMLSGQAVLSRYPILSQEVVDLPDPDSNGWLYELFYLHHVVQSVQVQIGRTTLHVVNVHLEAFDNETREEGAIITAELVKSLDDALVIAAGDFNSVPPQATLKEAFPDEPETDMSEDMVVETMGTDTGLVEVLGDAIYTTDEAKSFTFPADAPNRRLDYIFVTEDGLTVVDAHVMGTVASDHLPVVATLSFEIH